MSGGLDPVAYTARADALYRARPVLRLSQQRRAAPDPVAGAVEEHDVAAVLASGGRRAAVAAFRRHRRAGERKPRRHETSGHGRRGVLMSVSVFSSSHVPAVDLTRRCLAIAEAHASIEVRAGLGGGHHGRHPIAVTGRCGGVGGAREVRDPAGGQRLPELVAGARRKTGARVVVAHDVGAPEVRGLREVGVVSQRSGEGDIRGRPSVAAAAGAGQIRPCRPARLRDLPGPH